MFIGTGVYIDDLEAEIATLRFRILLGVAGIAMSLALLAWVISRRITAPIGGLQVTLKHIADGDLAMAVPHNDRKDEVGSMALCREPRSRQSAWWILNGNGSSPSSVYKRGDATERFFLRPYDSNLGGHGYPRCDAG